MMVEWVPVCIGNGCQTHKSCYAHSGEDLAESLHVMTAHRVIKIGAYKSFLINMVNWFDQPVTLQAHRNVVDCQLVCFDGLGVYQFGLSQ